MIIGVIIGVLVLLVVIIVVVRCVMQVRDDVVRDVELSTLRNSLVGSFSFVFRSQTKMERRR